MIKKVYRWLSLIVLLLSRLTGLLTVAISAEKGDNCYIWWTNTEMV